MLRSGADELVERFHDGAQGKGRPVAPNVLEALQKTLLAKFVPAAIARFGHAVRINHQTIALVKVSAARHVLFVHVDPERNTFRFEPVDRPIQTKQNRRMVPGRKIRKLAGARLELRDECGREAA